MTANGISLGQAIADARKKAHLSQKELAARIRRGDGKPISAQYLNDIEHNRRSPGSSHLIDQFSKTLGITREYLAYLAGRIPEDIRRAQLDEHRFMEAMQAFRRTLGRPRKSTKGSFGSAQVRPIG